MCVCVCAYIDYLPPHDDTTLAQTLFKQNFHRGVQD